VETTCPDQSTANPSGKSTINAQIKSQAVTKTLTQRREMTKAFIAQLRARLAQRYHFQQSEGEGIKLP
jgi:hypothetical protein